MEPEHLDVLVVGAGLSGVGAGYRLQTSCPERSWAILEARSSLGGTWDLFRFPGIRSDSDMFTLSFPFRPWSEARSIVEGASIRQYIEETAAQFGIDRKVRFGQRVTSASWDSAAARWTVEVNGGERVYTCNFLYMCSGYYRYDQGYTPAFEGLGDFRGPVVHPQSWPADLDYAGQNVVVVGSGATAVTLVPALAQTARHVTMLQRSPSYVTSLPRVDPVAVWLQRTLPPRWADRATRLKSIVLTQAFYQYCRRFPARAARTLGRLVAARLPAGYPMDPDFSPRYDPWDQRLCLVPDGDLFEAISAGRASVVTGTIDRFTGGGVRLSTGTEVPADIVVTATGLQLQLGGGAALFVDGRPLRPSESFVYRGCMLSGVPNFAVCIGYTNASWTLRADLSSRYVCRLLCHMSRHGYRVATPEHRGRDVARPLLDLTSGYVQRARDDLPRQGARPPWRVRQNYILDYFTATRGALGNGMRWAAAEATGPESSASGSDAVDHQTRMMESSPP